VKIAAGAVLLDLSLQRLVDINGFRGRGFFLRTRDGHAETERQENGKEPYGKRADIQCHNLLYFLVFTIRQRRIMAHRSRGCETGMRPHPWSALTASLGVQHFAIGVLPRGFWHLGGRGGRLPAALGASRLAHFKTRPRLHQLASPWSLKKCATARPPLFFAQK